MRSAQRHPLRIYSSPPMDIVTPKLDHVVIDTRNRIDEAVRTYLSLGFQLTDRGRHTLGSVNHLAIFETDYMEFLGFDDNAGAVRADILRFPVGLNGLVFATDKPEVLFGDLRERGLAVEQPIAFSRPVALADRIEDAKFRVVRLGAEAVSFGRVYFCHISHRNWCGDQSGVGTPMARWRSRRSRSRRKIRPRRPSFSSVYSVQIPCGRRQPAFGV